MNACASLQTESKAYPPECDFPAGLNGWKPLPDTLYQKAPSPARIPPSVKTEELYNIIGETRDATEKYNEETLPNIKDAAVKQDEKVDEYNVSIKEKAAICKAAREKWEKERDKRRGFFS